MTRFLWALLMGVALSSCAAQKEPLTVSYRLVQNSVFSSTREVRGLSWNGGTLWAATAGGALRFRDGKWSRWTRANGLPANESLGVDGNGRVRFPVASARFDGARWVAQSAPPFEKTAPEVQWRGESVRASLDGLELEGRMVALPAASRGTHISALMALGKGLEVAVYGDGLYQFDGAKWVPDEANVPEVAREITSLAGDGKVLWVGTRRSGIWRRQEGQWTHFLRAGEPFAHNVQFLARFRGVVWGSTLDDGLIYRTGASWEHVWPAELSSSAPRQMLVWHDTLFVRHGTGVVDSFDGMGWTKNALASIPRGGVYGLSGDDTRLVASGWGGFAEWDGEKWESHYDLPALKGVPVLGVLCDGDEVWVETQSRGAGVWNRKTGAFRWLDERSGLPDDWVTTMAKIGDTIYAGTFVGGLARLEKDKWVVVPELKGENVTSLCAAPGGGVLAATRHGVFKVKGESAKKLDLAWLDSEDQALLSDETGVWIGARTSLNFWATKGTR